MGLKKKIEVQLKEKPVGRTDWLRWKGTERTDRENISTNLPTEQWNG